MAATDTKGVAMSRATSLGRVLHYASNLSQTAYWFDRKFIPALQQFAHENRDREVTILDFGCGTKPYQPFVGDDLKGRYIGLDIYPGECVDVVYDGSVIPFPDESIDLVFSQSVFEHVEDLSFTMSEISRVLKRSGVLLAVVPFTNHLHGTPYDFHRPTRYGWESMLKHRFGSDSSILVEPVDGRMNCIANMITAQMNLAVLDVLRFARNRVAGPGRTHTPESGATSPESHATAGMRAAYVLAALNPINILLGASSWMLSAFRVPRRVEGEITSGYFIRVQKAAPVPADGGPPSPAA